MPGLPHQPKMVGRWSWSTDLLVDVIAEVSLIAGLALMAGLIMRDIVSNNRGALWEQKVV
jgi:hypothetical protein